MIQIFNFISGISFWLYSLCLIVFVFAVRAWWLAQQERRHTIYSLEKETAGESGVRALTFALFAVMTGVVVYYADANADHLPLAAPQRSPTPNLALFITPTATVPPPPPTPAPPTPTPLRSPLATPTPRVPPTNTPSPATPVPPPPICPDPSARLTAPGVDAHLFGVVTVRGSANIPNFQYYKIEYGIGENPPGWVVIGDLRRQPVFEGVLATFNADAFAPGIYHLRLTVVDQRGNFPIPPCVVRVIMGQ